MDLFISVFPIVLLIYLMVKKNALPSYKALPLIALLVFLLQLFYFKMPFVNASAFAVQGIVAAATPISVIFGAILFNRMMEASGSINVIRTWLSNINPNPVAQLMIIGWAFAFMIEGASGFGTPAAIAAPILVGLGFNPFKVAVFTLVMNSVPVSFGAVGTPTWFGMGPLKLAEADILDIGAKTAFIHFIAGFIIPIMALLFITTWKEIKKNIVFIYISILACTIPYVILAQYNYEFPSLVAGAIGLCVSVYVANLGIGLSKNEEKFELEKLPLKTVLKAFFPLGLLIFILIITRIHQLGIKALLNDATTWVSLHLGAFDLEISKALIFNVKNIFGTGISESYKTLYVPSLIPFIITVIIAFIVYRTRNVLNVYVTSVKQSEKPLYALIGALIMVKLMTAGGDNSMVKVIGKNFAEFAKDSWIYYASYLGAIGAFFSGSNTVSNITFSGIQQQIAIETGLNVNQVLATQSVGGAMGNMVCINNIVAVCSVLNVNNQEGAIIKRTIIPMTIYGIITAAVVYIVW